MPTIKTFCTKESFRPPRNHFGTWVPGGAAALLVEMGASPGSLGACAEFALPAGISAGGTSGDFFSRINLRFSIPISF
jgi:hypothetical protein